jgi:hypothetical protein
MHTQVAEMTMARMSRLLHELQGSSLTLDGAGLRADTGAGAGGLATTGAASVLMMPRSRIRSNWAYVRWRDACQVMNASERVTTEQR